jgi:hypothetical protein
MPSPTYIPVVRAGADMSFNTVTVTGGGVTATGAYSMTGAAAGTTAFASIVTLDTFDRFRITADGGMAWGPGNGARDTTLVRSGNNALQTPGFFAMGSGQSSGTFSVFGGDVIIGTAGQGLKVKEGANAAMGVATLVAGTVTVATTRVTATSRIQLTAQSLGTVTAPKALAVTARTGGTSFTITSADATDTSVVAWEIIEPA